jgi:hypothetical protein
MKSKNVAKRKEARILDFLRGSQSKEGKVQNRWDNGGYHKPGSNKK